MPNLRIIFMGTAKLACDSLSALKEQSDFEIVGVVTQPDKPKGRDLKLSFSPVKELAAQYGLSVLQPTRARDAAFVDQLRALTPDLIVVAAYGQILPKAILDLPRWGCLNVHTSLLPKYRGAAPIQWAILNGETETGITIMQMDTGLDTGAILEQQSTPILPDDTSDILHDRLAKLGGDLLITTIRKLVTGTATPHPQSNEQATYAAKINKTDGQLDWNLSAKKLVDRLRAFTPWPGVFSYLPAEPKPQLIKIWRANEIERSGAPGVILEANVSGIVVACGENALQITELQREGGRRISAQQFLSGHPLKPGDHFAPLGA